MCIPNLEAAKGHGGEDMGLRTMGKRPTLSVPSWRLNLF